ncbi:MAG: hypothetical protein EOO89_07965 [Pedobacter sp.]|nr:MAG: hypothetical protein EOO89_07965 [Pedobacter sp.]
MFKTIFKGFQKLHGKEKAETEAEALTAKTVWKENNSVNGLLTKSTFMPFIKALRAEDYEHTDYLFQILWQRARFSSRLKLKTDRGGNSYYWGGIYKPNGSDGAKIMANPELVNLVQQYIDGKVYIDFDLDDLIDEGLTEQ